MESSGTSPIDAQAAIPTPISSGFWKIGTGSNDSRAFRLGLDSDRQAIPPFRAPEASSRSGKGMGEEREGAHTVSSSAEASPRKETAE
jgi:hypothetical protein